LIWSEVVASEVPTDGCSDNGGGEVPPLEERMEPWRGSGAMGLRVVRGLFHKEGDNLDRMERR
jgi:hypothetical protein